MAKYFDEEKWNREVKNPLWYLAIMPEVNLLWEKGKEMGTAEKDKMKEAVYGFFEKHLEANDIALGKTGVNWDCERKPIDTIVIHHTGRPKGISWRMLSAIELVRLYAQYYAEQFLAKVTPSKKINMEKVSPWANGIFSNHFRGKEQVFYAYHWLVREDGSVERLLDDNQIGWHAGNWDVNCKSIAICIDDDLEEKEPSELAIEGAAKVIRMYGGVKLPHSGGVQVLGHGEVNLKTVCPGEWFLKGGKEKIIKSI